MVLTAQVYSRFYTQNIAYPPSFIPVFPVRLSDGVDIVDTENPFILCKLDLSNELVHMFDQRTEDFSVSRFCLRGHEANNMLGEIRVKLVGIGFGTIGAVDAISSHDEVWCGNVNRLRCEIKEEGLV